MVELFVGPDIAGVLIEENEVGRALLSGDSAAAAKHNNIDTS